MGMGKREIIDMALQLKAEERDEIAESIMQSLDKSDPKIEQAWQGSLGHCPISSTPTP